MKIDSKIITNSKINCSVACLHLNDHRFLMDELNYVNCPGFEFMIYTLWTEHHSEVALSLKEGGFRFDSVHSPKQIGRLLSDDNPKNHELGRKLLKDSIDLAHRLDASIVTTHLWDQNSNDPKLERNLNSLYMLKDYAIEKGISVSVEFIPHINGGGYVSTAQYLYNNMDPAFSFTLDLEFASWNDEIADMVKFADRISNAHIRDYNGSPVDENGRRHYCLPGMGKTDFAFTFRELTKNSYKGFYTLEARHYSTKDVNDSLEMLFRLHEDSIQASGSEP